MCNDSHADVGGSKSHVFTIVFWLMIGDFLVESTESIIPNSFVVYYKTLNVLTFCNNGKVLHDLI